MCSSRPKIAKCRDIALITAAKSFVVHPGNQMHAGMHISRALTVRSIRGSLVDQSNPRPAGTALDPDFSMSASENEPLVPITLGELGDFRICHFC
jgi:hypothetical protein